MNRQGGETQREVEEVRVFLTANAHVFRAEFVEDKDLEAIPVNRRFDVKANIFPETIDIAGPFPPADTKAGAKEDAVVRSGGWRSLRRADPRTGPASVSATSNKAEIAASSIR